MVGMKYHSLNGIIFALTNPSNFCISPCPSELLTDTYGALYYMRTFWWRYPVQLPMHLDKIEQITTQRFPDENHEDIETSAKRNKDSARREIGPVVPKRRSAERIGVQLHEGPKPRQCFSVRVRPIQISKRR